MSNVNNYVIESEEVIRWNNRPRCPLKSQEIPQDNNGPVVIVVGKNFHDIVINSSKDIFILFYTSWCPWCKKLMPIWEKLGKELQKPDDTIIAKMDTSANEYENLKINAVPTMKLYKASGGDSLIYPYKEPRTLDALLTYLKTV